MSDLADTQPIDVAAVTQNIKTGADGIIRARKGYLKPVRKASFGTYYQPCEDPNAPDLEESIVIDEDFPKVPVSKWIPWVSLAFKYLKPHVPGVKDAPDSTSEVSVILCRKAKDGGILPNGGTDPEHWRVLVPRQTVGADSVDADLTDLVDLLTGEVLKGVPTDLCHWGSSHSHNTMSAFFSGTDDANELHRPGLHIVVGELTEHEGGRRTYKMKASIVVNHKRYIIDDPWDVVERWDGVTPLANYHPKVLEYVTKKTYGNYSSKGSSSDRLTESDILRAFDLDDLSDLDPSEYPALTAYLASLRAEKDKEAEKKSSAARGSDIQRWLNEPGARLERGKMAPVMPIGIKLAVEQARKDAGGMKNSHLANCVRQVCNGIERMHQGSANETDFRLARRMLFDLVSDVAMWTAED